MPEVLVIDDDRLIRGFLRNYLRREGYEVLESASGPEGVQLAIQHQPALIILDYLMPDMDGKEVLRQLKESRRSRDIPVIVLTSADDLQTKLSFFQLGAADFLTKPFGKEEVAARVGAHINQVEANRLRVLVEFAGASAHELRQPLSVLSGYLDLIRGELRPDQEHVGDYLQRMAENLQRMADIIERMQATRQYRTQHYLGDVDIVDLGAAPGPAKPNS
jgi:DNA-binding response OmpR family regulator